MSATSEQILQQALSDPGLDELWVAEAHDRLDAYDRGELEAVDAEQVLRQI